MNNKFILVIFGVCCYLSLDAQYNFNIKRTFAETNHQIFYASYSTHGNYIITTGSDNNLIIWNTGTGIIYKTLPGLKKRPNSAIFDEEKNILISAGEDNEITIWDPLTSNISASLTGHKGAIKSISVDPAGRLLASGSEDRTVRIWDIASRSLIFELKGHKSQVNALSFSPDGSLLVSGGADKTIILWDIRNGSILNSRQAHSGWVRDVEFSPDGNQVASCGDDGLIIISKIPELSPVKTLKGHNDWVQTIDFSPDGKYMLSGGHDRIIMLWDVSTGNVIAQSGKQGQIVLSVDFCPLQPDFISSSLLSDRLEIWALTGLAGSYSNVLSDRNILKPAENSVKNINQVTGETRQENNVLPDFKPSIPENSVIELLSPGHTKGVINSDKNSIYLIGRVNDPEGTGTIIINNNRIELSAAGIFEYKLNLVKGANPVSMIAVNKMGNITEMYLVINSTSEEELIQETENKSIYRGKYYALLIGVNDYFSEEIADLENPINDAENLYNALLSGYTFDKENIFLLRNPTQSEIILKLDDLSRLLTSSDNLLIFFAGHGYWDEKGNVGYWFPADASRNSTVNWFRNSTLRDFIGSIQTKHTLLIADACFSGSIFKSRAAFTEAPSGIEKLYELPSRKAMTSGTRQEVPDESVFIKYLVRRLEENEEPYLTSELLFSSFKEAVMNNSPNIPQFGVIQNVGDEGGDFVFIKR